MEPRTNPYLDRFLESCNRVDCIEEFGYSIPSKKAIDRITKLSPIVEVGAGCGYWARMISMEGRISCFDSGETNWKHKWYPVREEDYRRGFATFPSWTAMIAWPWMDCNVILEPYKGNQLIFVGEEHQLPDWRISEVIQIPRWKWIHDRVYILERK